MTSTLAHRPRPLAGEQRWHGELASGGSDVRWIQSSLNTLLGLKLAVDGIAGPATRSAVRSFQRRKGLAPHGVVDSQTQATLERALSGARVSGAATAVSEPGQGCQVLDNFDFDDHRLKPEHLSKLKSLARQIVNSQTSSVRIIGHTDPVGDVDYNVRLGKRRADEAAAALRRLVDKLQTGSGSQLTVTVASSGEAGSGSSQPERDRRVDVCLPPVTVTPWPPGAVAPQPIPRRFCCLLAPEQINSLRANDNIADPASLGQHGGWSEVVGIVYCGKAGFLDLAHIRDSCDTTKFIFDRLASNKVPQTIFVTYKRLIKPAKPVGIASIQRRALRPIDLARVIAYDVGLGHEIATYYDMGVKGIDVGGHNSSFSPEDLCSNYLGTLLAERAMAAGGNFNAAVTAELNSLIRNLDGQTPAETLRAFGLINGRWVNRYWTPWKGYYPSITRADYLRRRNFTRAPWPAGHSSDKQPPSYVTAALPAVGPSTYTYVHTEEASTRRLGVLFPRYISLIRQDARQRYGTNYDKPV